MSDNTASTQQAAQDAEAPGHAGAASGDEVQQQAPAGSAADDEATDWKAKFEAQQKVNKDLDKKVKADRDLRQKFEALEAKLNGTEAEYQQAQEAQAIKDAALAKANERVLNAELRVAAKGRLADPADALKFLDLSEFEVGDDGSVDSQAIEAAIGDLVESKPYLAAQGGSGVTFESPGSHRKERAGQVTKAQLEQMTPEQINAARAEGRLNALLGINK